MVRLKDNVLGDNNQYPKFQFQYGTIKSTSLNRCIEYIIKFQFQYGTIKSKSPFVKELINARFNSNMVRLKVI